MYNVMNEVDSYIISNKQIQIWIDPSLWLLKFEATCTQTRERIKKTNTNIANIEDFMDFTINSVEICK